MPSHGRGIAFWVWGQTFSGEESLKGHRSTERCVNRNVLRQTFREQAVTVVSKKQHFFYCWDTAYHNHIPALQRGIAERAADAHAIHATNGSSSLTSISAERLHGWRIAFASVTFVDRIGTHLKSLLQAARELK